MGTSTQKIVGGSGVDRKEIWKKVSNLEKKAVELLSEGDEVSVDEAYKLLAQSVAFKKKDPFIQLAEKYGALSSANEDGEYA